MNQIVVLVGAALVAIGLTVLLRFTPFGLVDPGDGRLAAHRVDRRASTPPFVSAASWMVGTMLAGLAGVLLSPDPRARRDQFTLLLVASFAAVVVGRLTSLPLAFAGAILIGLVQERVARVAPARRRACSPTGSGRASRSS